MTYTILCKGMLLVNDKISDIGEGEKRPIIQINLPLFYSLPLYKLFSLGHLLCPRIKQLQIK